MASLDPQRPNVILVVTDDQGPWALGRAGNTDIHTPNLDALADDGLYATRFFCTSPVCSPARASLLTGRMPSQHGIHDWLSGGHTGADRVDFLADQTLITDLLAHAGYRCGLVGKWHLGANDVPRPGFVHWYAHESGGGPYYGATMFRNGRAESVPGYLTYALTREAVAFLNDEAPHPEPFFLALHYTAPHSPWKGHHPVELTERYEHCAFKTCPQTTPHPWQPTVDGRPVGGEHDTRAALIGYFAAITGVDNGVGDIRSAVSELGLSESTLVVFMSDNGFNCGHHGIWGKGNGTRPQNMYDSSVMVPAIFTQPGRIPGGRTSDTLLSGYDLVPTLLDYLGVDHGSDPETPGRSFADLLAGTSSGPDNGRVVVYDEYGPVRMIRTQDHKYVHRWPHGPHELYDLRADPGETHNLCGRRADLAEPLRRELSAWFARYSDPAHDGACMPVSGRGQHAPTNPGAFA